MKKLTLIFISILLFVIPACKNAEKATVTDFSKDNNYMEMAVLYHQQSAEIKALYYQSFRLARLMFEQDLLNASVAKKRAVVVDIDETMLDNSPYQAKCVLENISYPSQWDEWCNKGIAEALPGTLDFLNYVASNSAEVFYVSNRMEDQRQGTLKNLKEKGFPFADNEHLMLKTVSTNKEIYRQQIAGKYHISLLIGDNLSDFISGFDKQPAGTREYKVDSLRSEFGKRFIILPNAMYGDWESALYQYNYKRTEKQKDSCRKAGLKSF